MAGRGGSSSCGGFDMANPPGGGVMPAPQRLGVLQPSLPQIDRVSQYSQAARGQRKLAEGWSRLGRMELR